MNAREVAFDLLLRWECCRRPADELLEEHRGIGELSACDRALATELFYGCLRHNLALEFLVSKLVRKRPRPALNGLLRLGFYQVFYLNMAPHAAVNETVELAKQRVSRREAQFVNAVLRRACNNRVIFITELLRTRTDAPWVFFSHPKWLWQRWAARLGTELTRQLCEWNNQPAPLYVRGDHPWPGVLEPTSLHPLCYRVKEPAKFFANCKSYYVQDPSTLIAVDVLDPQPVESVLDLCAAPGGKTTYIAQKMQNRGRVVAVDVSAQRLGLVRENCQRLGVSIVSAVACDGRRADCCLRGAQFDRVLVDVPCSNTGVMRRRPDLRWRLRESEIARLSVLQQELLEAGSRLTRKNGVLVYSTCSLEPEENERVVERFRAVHPEFALETTRSTFPPRDGLDGIFVARFRRL